MKFTIIGAYGVSESIHLIPISVTIFPVIPVSFQIMAADISSTFSDLMVQ